MRTSIVKASSIESFYQPSTNNYFTFGRGWMIYVEGLGYWGIFDTKKAAQNMLNTNPDFASFREDAWFQEQHKRTFMIRTLGDLRNFINSVDHLNDDTIIDDQYIGSGFEGFTILGNKILAETYS